MLCIFGVLFDVVLVVVWCYENMKLECFLWMVDFVRFIMVVEFGFGWDVGEFMGVYEVNKKVIIE